MDENKEETTDKEKETNIILELTSLLSSVDLNSPEAVLNATTISDNNGGRILL